MCLIQSVTNNTTKIYQHAPLPSPVWRPPSQTVSVCTICHLGLSGAWDVFVCLLVCFHCFPGDPTFSFLLYFYSLVLQEHIFQEVFKKGCLRDESSDNSMFKNVILLIHLVYS